MTPQKISLLLCLGISVLFSATFWNARIHPHLDLPFHLAQATIQSHFDDADNEFSTYYSLRSELKPNRFHRYFCSLGVFSSVEQGNRVFFALYFLLFTLSVFFLIQVLGGNPFFSLLALVFMLHRAYFSGFVDYIFSVPLYIFLVGLSVSYFKQERSRDIVLLALLSTALFFVHGITSAIWIGSYSAFLVGWYFSTKPFNMKALFPLTLLGFLLILWQFRFGDETTGGLFPYLLKYYSGEYWSLLGTRLLRFFSELTTHFAFLPVFWARLISLVLTVVVYALALSWIDWKQLRSQPLFASLPLPFALLCGAVILALAFLPDHTIQVYGIAPRIYVLLHILALCFFSGLARPLPKRVRIIFLIPALLCFTMYFLALQDFNKKNSGFDSDFFPDRNEGILGTATYEDFYAGTPTFYHFGNFFTIWNHGISTLPFLDAGFTSIGRGPGGSSLPETRDYIRDDLPIAELQGYLKHLDYVLLRGNIPDTHQPVFTAWTLVRETGAWRLYQNPRGGKSKPAAPINN